MPPTNLDRHKAHLERLSQTGDALVLALKAEFDPVAFKNAVAARFGKEEAERLSKSPVLVRDVYQSWYTEAQAVIRQLAPERLADFVRHYEPAKNRKSLDGESYRIEDYLRGLANGWGGPKAAGPHLAQQVAILKAVTARFESSLFDIRSLVQADLFDTELDAARSLNTHGYARAAGAMAGVVLEHHLTQVCDAHQVKSPKKSPSIADLNEALKAAGVVEVAQWRFIQHLADIRNKCDHKKTADPTSSEVADLLDGVTKIIKTVL